MSARRASSPADSRAPSGPPKPPSAATLEFLRDIIEAVGDALFIHEAESGKILYVNARMREMYGYDKEDALELDVGAISSGAHPYTNEEALRWMQKSRAECPQTFEWLSRHRSGHTFWVEVSLRFAVLGTKECIVATVRDIDKRKNADAALARRMLALTRPLDDDPSQVDFTDLFDIEDVQRLQDAFAAATGVASIITYPDGTPITKPSNFCYLCEHIIRKTEKGLRNCYHSDAILGRADRGGPSMQPCLSGGLWDGGTSVYVGNRHVANWLIGQVLDESSDRQRLMAYASEIGADPQEFSRALDDVTLMPQGQFRKVCEALHVFALQLSTLAYRNVQQARDIEERRRAAEERSRLEEQLRQSQKMESVGRLAGGIAHDFNNLLVPILGYAELLLEEAGSDEGQRKQLQEILDAAQRSRDLVKQLLAFGRKQVLKLNMVDLREVLLSVITWAEGSVGGFSHED